MIQHPTGYEVSLEFGITTLGCVVLDSSSLTGSRETFSCLKPPAFKNELNKRKCQFLSLVFHLS